MIELTSAPTTKIEIISAAISMVGKQKTVNTIDGGGALAIDAEKLYDTLVSAELGSNRWRFAQAFQQISIITTLNPTFDGWLYECQIPADCIMVQYLYPNIQYIVFGDKILTKSNQTFTLIYSRNVPVSKWPPPFSLYIVYHLASMLGISVTNSDRMLARISQGMQMWESRALFADAQSSVTLPFRHNPYVDVRYRYKTRGH
ncbi:TPA: hypothetical protein ACG3NN_002854 [Legionella pneumophila]